VQRPECPCASADECTCARCETCSVVLLEIEKTDFCGPCVRKRAETIAAGRTCSRCGRSPCLYSTDLAREFEVCDACGPAVRTERLFYQKGMLDEREAVAKYLERHSFSARYAQEIREERHRK